MTIRTAEQADLPAIVEIFNAAIATRMATAVLEPVTLTSGANDFTSIRWIDICSSSWSSMIASPDG